MTLAARSLPASIARVLDGRGIVTDEAIGSFLSPSLDRLVSPHAFSQMQMAVDRLLAAIKADQPIAVYADRDVDGLTGLTVLVRTLRTLGATVIWGSPVRGRGVERDVIEKLSAQSKVMVLVDCGTGEQAELAWLASQGVDVIIADHHRLTAARPPAFAWIHPGVLETSEGAAPAGCVMAFKLAQALWMSFLGADDPARMDYFLFSHLDVIALGILADRMPLQGENRVLVWHGLRRLACSRKTGLASLMRFFRLTPRSSPLTVREATWQLIPLLNAGGRLGRPDLTADLLITEDADVARGCIDQLLGLNQQRRAAQDVSLASFEKAVLEQCSVESDPVLVALAEGLEPSVTGLAAQSLVRKYGRPTFLFVDQGEHAVGSGRGLAGFDLFSWIETHQEVLVKFGGHEGAVGMTLRTVDFAAFRSRLMTTAGAASTGNGWALGGDSGEISTDVEVAVTLDELDEAWWRSLNRLAPFGKGNPMPLFQIDGVESIVPVVRNRSKKPADEFILKSGGCEIRARYEEGLPTPLQRWRPPETQWRKTAGEGPWSVTGYPAAVNKTDGEFIWMIRKIGRADG